MFQDREKRYQVYHTLLSMALCWALALVINQYYELRVPIFLSAFFSFLPALMIYLFDLNKRNTVTYIVIASIIPILALLFWARKFNPIDWMQDYTNWIVIYNGTEQQFVAHHSNFTIFAVGVLGALLFFLLTKTQLSKIALAIAIMAAMIVLSVSEINTNKVVVGICIFYILSIVVECYGIIYTRKSGKQEKKESVLYLAPICLMLAVLAIALPSKPEPLQWKAVKNIYNNVKEQFEIWRTDLDYYFRKPEGEFFVSLTGYSEDSGELGKGGGTLITDNKVAMKVNGSTRSRAVYLIGSVSDIYTGSRWDKSREGYLTGEKEYKLDYMELAYALSRQDLEVLENNRFVERVTFEVQFNNIKTKTFFYPLKTSWFDMISNPEDIIAEPSNITFEKVRGRGTAYESIFYEMNLQGDAFTRILREADAFSYDSAPSAKLESIDWLMSNSLLHDNTESFASRWDFYELLGKRAELIKMNYTTLPGELPNRVRELAEEITADSDNTFDKLKAIENYLREYNYTLSPGRVPEEADFTDYFLFEGKEGYCTSYATAMAVLGRCIGVPTRYVEGFVAKFESKDENNMYPVRNSQAHAWAEAYIEGIGWIPFEATAPFFNFRYTKWADPKKQVESSADYKNPYEQYMNELANPYLGEIVPTQFKQRDKIEEIIVTVLVSLAAILILFILLISYFNVLKYRYKKAYNKADESNKMYMMFLRILTLLKQEGFELEEQETIWMLSQRVKDRFHYNKTNFPDVANVFMRYRYAEEEVAKEELEQVVIYQQGLALKQKGENPRIKLWLKEYIFLMKNRKS